MSHHMEVRECKPLQVEFGSAVCGIGQPSKGIQGSVGTPISYGIKDFSLDSRS